MLSNTDSPTISPRTYVSAPFSEADDPAHLLFPPSVELILLHTRPRTGALLTPSTPKEWAELERCAPLCRRYVRANERQQIGTCKSLSLRIWRKHTNDKAKKIISFAVLKKDRRFCGSLWIEHDLDFFLWSLYSSSNALHFSGCFCLFCF